MRSLPLLVTLVVVLVNAVPSRAAPFVIVGIADVDATTTTLQAIDLDDQNPAGTIEVGVLHHGAGETPNGVLVDDRRLATISPRDGELRLFDLQTRDERSLTAGLMRNQRPVPTTTKRGLALVGLRQQDAGFDVVAVHVGDSNGDDGDHDDDVKVDVLASTGPRGWAAVVPRASTAKRPSSTITVLGIDAGSDHARLFDLDVDVDLDGATTLVQRTDLGGGVFRGGVLRSDGRLLVEHEGVAADSGARVGTLLQLGAQAKKLGRGADVGVRGLVGLSPVVGGARAASSTGDKDGTIVVDDGRGAGFVRWPAVRVGVARPQAITSSGDVVVVTTVFRGQSLPSELWAVRKAGGRALLTPPARTVVTVYGLSGGWR